MKSPLRLAVALLALLLVACGAQMVQERLNEQYGAPQAHSRRVDRAASAKLDFFTEVQPVLERRCVVCHGCYDAPCQLKLTSPEGVERGASKTLVYEPSRVVQAEPSRLFEDALSVEQWRSRGFFPVVNEREDAPQANLDASVLTRMLRLKAEHPLKAERRLSGFDFSLAREQSCPTIEEFPEYEKEHPHWGMPYGLPAVSPQELETLERWIAEGAGYSEREPLAPAMREQVLKWETRLNGDDLRSQLSARYLFEHLFLAHLYFEGEGEAEAGSEGDEHSVFFELVRSRTPAPEPIERIVTRRPHEDPSVPRVFYRLQPVRSSLVEKTHMPYALSEERWEKWKAWFFDASFKVTHLPGYGGTWASNPFRTFLQIPVGSRYRFLVDEARFTLDGFIKGPVCRGQTSLNVIQDRFWVYFLDPNNVDQAEADFYASEIEHLTLPPDEKTGTLVLARWLEFAERERRYLEKKGEFLRKKYAARGGKPIDLRLIWDGDKTNRNAVLTVLRHEDSASVVQGQVGAPPKTSWVLGYGILERIHYLLVADFDVFGNLAHQLVTRIYMDFLRMEAEANFVGFLPRWSRESIVAGWYEGAESEALGYVLGRHRSSAVDTALAYESRNPELELYELLGKHLEAVDARRFDPAHVGAAAAALARSLESQVGGGIKWMPEMSLVRVGGPAEAQYLTLLRDDEHTNILSVFGEESRRRPGQDRMTVVGGLLGAYPNALFEVEEEELSDFGSAVAALDSEQAYDRLRDRYGVRRSDAEFWDKSDRIHEELMSQGWLTGRLDFNRLENR